MNKDSELNIKTDTRNEIDFNHFSGPVASAESRSFSRRLKQLRHWLKASLDRHEKRTAKLRVYRQSRTGYTGPAREYLQPGQSDLPGLV
ncbi:MAG: hypothetical protein OES20_14860 [Gammaproteobacteria bacterium]|nr:hypothetical protein [Gammaproteobacteria bacterium]MDH3856485.1 hypothetical protein [Gammaproteobacteria bacterium]